MRESVLQAGTYTSSSFRAVNASFWWRRHRFAASFFVLVCFFCVCGLKRQLPQHFNLPAHRLIKLVIDCLLASVLEVSRQTATDMTSLGGVPGVLHLENPSRDARRRLVIGDRCAQNLTFRSRNASFRPFVQKYERELGWATGACQRSSGDGSPPRVCWAEGARGWTRRSPGGCGDACLRRTGDHHPTHRKQLWRGTFQRRHHRRQLWRKLQRTTIWSSSGPGRLPR